MKTNRITGLIILITGTIFLLSSCKPKGPVEVVMGDAASRVYVAPGKYDEFYSIVSGGFNGQIGV